MTTVNTQISGGFKNLITTFFKANELQVEIEESDSANNHLILHYEDESDTAYSITYMSVKHLGFENMLCDYLIRCGVSPLRIGNGRESVKRDMKELDEMWEQHRRQIGLA